jgi:hypothetical protein
VGVVVAVAVPLGAASPPEEAACAAATGGPTVAAAASAASRAIALLGGFRIVFVYAYEVS